MDGITLIALIITIIVLLILAAVTINAAFNSGIIDTAVNGVVNYANAQNKERVTFEDLHRDIQDIVKKIEDYSIKENIDYGSSENGKLKFITKILGRPKPETNDTIEITAVAVDDNENAELTYTLWWENEEGELEKTNVVARAKQGNPVILTKLGLNNYTTYKCKVSVSNGEDEAISIEDSVKTYCKGLYCDEGGNKQRICAMCNNLKKVVCKTCNGLSTKDCRNL